uniref:Uncharacterized protein n=1 Tax=Denticeps clupeoides TaxID=299321 RepID=A0AAY4D676_9TELE
MVNAGQNPRRRPTLFTRNRVYAKTECVSGLCNMYEVLLKSYCVLMYCICYLFKKKKRRIPKFKLFYILTVNIKVDIYIMKRRSHAWFCHVPKSRSCRPRPCL